MKQLSVIGISRSGKTCYLYAMAKTMLGGCAGLNVNAIDREASLKLKAGWREIRRNAKWPPATDFFTKTAFNCSLFLRPVMDFLWNDFKGGALYSTNEVDDKFYREFEEFLESSDGLIIFVAANELQDILLGVEDSDLIQEDLESLTELFIRNKVALSQIPVTIVISKADLLTEKEKPYVLEIVKEIFKPLFQVGNNMKVLTVPVCIGTNLGRCSQGESIQGVVFQNPNDGNIHIPILFNLYHFLKDCISVERANLGDIEARIQNHKNALNRAESHNGLQRWWNGEDRDEIRQQISDARKNSQQKLEEIKNLERELDKVVSLFSGDCSYFINGKKVSL